MARMKRSVKARKWLRSDRYINREFSWLQFNSRVLSEAANPTNPLLERLKFLAIFNANLDEFYMVRVSGLTEQHESGMFELSPDGLSPTEQLRLIRKTVRPLRLAVAELMSQELLPQLQEVGVRILSDGDLSERQRRIADTYFRREVFPLCTPLVLHPAPSVPFISNRSLNIAVLLHDEFAGRKLARVKVPTILPRAMRLARRSFDFLLLEDLIRNNLDALFPGVSIEGAHMFRVIRDADVEIRELEAGDLIESIEQTLRLRRFGDPVLLEVGSDMPEETRSQLVRLLEIDESEVVALDGIIGYDVLWELAAAEKPALRFPTFQPYLSDSLSSAKSLFQTIEATDALVHQPFDSFRPVEHFVASAALDPEVIGIKMTLYRVGAQSPIVDSLLRAAEAGKQVAVMVELKARFDETNNLAWARSLERAGVHVTYGFAELKTHCKLCLIVRRSGESIRTYAHIGTGNYNPSNALAYTDFGMFTSDCAITEDIAELFNFLTGFSRQRNFRRLLVAPIGLREGVIQRIRREARAAAQGADARIIFKLNSLVDPETIDALYEASESGVRVDLIVRGICALRPGIAGLSKNITVISVVGRYLEHSRLLYFENGGEPDVLIGSADLMRRNLDRRVEVLAPVDRPEIVWHLKDVLERYLEDNTNAWEMSPEGTYRRRVPGSAEPFSAQCHMMDHPATKLLFPPDIEAAS